MKNSAVAKMISWLALALVVLPCLAIPLSVLSLPQVQWCAFVGTVTWFLTSPLWMSKEPEIDDAEVEI